MRLTPLRRRVLELVWKSHEPVKAYDILQTLSAEKKGAAPPTVYRALNDLMKKGMVHRLESRSAFVACGHGACDGKFAFAVCRACDKVVEILLTN